MFNDRGYFIGKNCSVLSKCVSDATGTKVDIRKTDTFLIINHAKNGVLKTLEVRANGPVYCIMKQTIDDLINLIKEQ